VPLSKSRAQQFDELVLTAIDRIERVFPELGDIEIRVDDVPSYELRDGSPDPIPLGRLERGTDGSPYALVVHRRPIELRTEIGTEREDLVADTVTELVAESFGVSPSQVDPDYGLGRK
jgi:predicted Zn-dependent protease with MMP-like domain